MALLARHLQEQPMTQDWSRHLRAVSAPQPTSSETDIIEALPEMISSKPQSLVFLTYCIPFLDKTKAKRQCNKGVFRYRSVTLLGMVMLTA
jgi:hypothetical protein